MEALLRTDSLLAITNDYKLPVVDVVTVVVKYYCNNG